MKFQHVVFAGLILPLSACVIAIDGNGPDQGSVSPKTGASDRHGEGRHDPAAHAADLPAPPSGMDAEATFLGTDGEETGRVIVTDGPLGVLMRVDLSGIAEGFHGVHLHQVGDCSDPAAGFKASGSHINPAGNAHGLMNEDGHELADLPNLYAHHTGHIRSELFVHRTTLGQLRDGDGFAVLVHANEDDHVTQPIGGAGARIACAAFPG